MRKMQKRCLKKSKLESTIRLEACSILLNGLVMEDATKIRPRNDWGNTNESRNKYKPASCRLALLCANVQPTCLICSVFGCTDGRLNRQPLWHHNDLTHQ